MSNYVKNVLVGLTRPTTTATIKRSAAAAVASNSSQVAEHALSLILGCSESFDHLAINDGYS